MSRRPHNPTAPRRAVRYAGLLLMALPLLLIGCQANSPSEPAQQPGTPPGTGPSNATYNLIVSLSPNQIPAGSTDPVTVSVRVVRVDTGQPPPSGTTVVLSASAGAFGSQGGSTSAVVETLNGRATASYFPPTAQGSGSVVIQARLENSVGQAILAIAEPATFFINALDPNTGSPSGGDHVSILGGGFETPVRVTFGGTPAQVLSVAANRIRVVTPPSATNVPVGTTSTVDVLVTINLNETTQASDTLGRGFTYAPGGSAQRPAVFSVTPASGPNEGGTRVTINGDGFESPVQVFFGSGGSATSFNGVEASVESVTNTRIVAVTPPAESFGQNNQNQIVDILVKNVNSGFSTIASSAFQYGTQVLITSIRPAEGLYTGGTLVTVFGQGFDQPVAVEMGTKAQSIVSVSGTEIVIRTVPVQIENCTEPSGPTKVVNIESGDGADDGPVFTYRVLKPIITGVNPTSGPEGGSNTVTIVGENFEPQTRVLFGDQAGSVQSVSADGTEIVVKVPAFSGTLNTQSCGDGGERFIPTAVNVQVTNLLTDCMDTFMNGYLYNPADTSCRNETPPPPTLPQCSDGIDNDGDGLTDYNGGVSPPGDPQCTSDGDNSEAS